jgi:hypothetical protein
LGDFTHNITGCILVDFTHKTSGKIWVGLHFGRFYSQNIWQNMGWAAFWAVLPTTQPTAFWSILLTKHLVKSGLGCILGGFTHKTSAHPETEPNFVTIESVHSIL